MTDLSNLDIPEAPEKRTGICEAIRISFDSGSQTVQEVTESMAEQNISCSPATISTQVNRLRRECGLSNGSRERTGVVRQIRELFSQDPEGSTKETILEGLEILGISTSLNTVNTQLSRLRKEFGIQSPGNQGRGICAMIRHCFLEQNVVTVEHMKAVFEANNIPVSPNTLKTQVGKLRKENGLTKPRDAK
ncbi:MAG: hypothetical protein V3T23_07965 [Nitrososphaerales archaeon]